MKMVPVSMPATAPPGNEQSRNICLEVSRFEDGAERSLSATPARQSKSASAR
jgi:hypothetical protein